MNGAVDVVIDRVRAGKGTAQDFDELHEYLMDPDRNFDRIYSAITNYLKFSVHIDWSIADAYVSYPVDPMVSATTISTAALAGCPADYFWKCVVEIAWGVEWDVDNDARIQALLALSSMPGGCVEAREIIRHNLLSDSEAVRDTAAIAAQRCFGRDEMEIVDGGLSGRLIEMVGTDVLNWLFPERDLYR